MEQAYTSEQKERLVEAVNAVIDALYEAFKRIAEVIKPTIEATSYFACRYWKSISRYASPSNVYHLAYYGRRARMRKKNMARIYRAIHAAICK